MPNFSVPFSITPQGTIATTSDPNKIATDRVESLVGTYPGERVMQPSYGVDVPGFLFAPDIVNNTDLLELDIKLALNKWEPTLVLTDIIPIVSQSDVGIVDINVEFTLSNDPTVTPVLTATVLVGGQVVQN